MLSSSRTHLSLIYGGAIFLLAVVAACNAYDGGTETTSVKIQRDTNIASYDGLSSGDEPTDEECDQFFAEFGTTPDDAAWGYDSDTGELSAQSTLLGGGDRRKGKDIFTWIGEKCFGSKKGDPKPGGGGTSGTSGKAAGPEDPERPAGPRNCSIPGVCQRVFSDAPNVCLENGEVRVPDTRREKDACKDLKNEARRCQQAIQNSWQGTKCADELGRAKLIVLACETCQ